MLGSQSLETSKAFWERFTPSALQDREVDRIVSVFRVERDWSRPEVVLTQKGEAARIALTGDADIEAAARQACRLLALDVDARAWPEVGDKDPVIGDAQALLLGLRSCGFHSPYEAAAWSILSLRIRITQAAVLRPELVRRHGDGGGFPAPATLRAADLSLPGRKPEYLRVMAEPLRRGAWMAAPSGP